MAIYDPREDSFLLNKWVKKMAQGNVLDMGTGSGMQALSVYDRVKFIVGLDVNPEAVKRVEKSLEKADIKNMLVFKSDLFSAFQDKKNIEKIDKHGIKEIKFDTIIFNPPYLPEDEWEDEDTRQYTTGGKEGWEILEKFFSEVGNFLKDEGIVLIVFSSLTGKEKVDDILSKKGFRFKQLEKNAMFFEELYVYMVENDTPRSQG